MTATPLGRARAADLRPPCGSGPRGTASLARGRG